MNKWTRTFLMATAAVVPLVGVLFWLFFWGQDESSPALHEIRALARAGRFDQAQSRLERFLQVSPGNGQAHLLMAQFALDRANPSPASALEHLRQIRPENSAKAAVVQFCIGKAHYQLARYDLAEASWMEALQIDPTVPEAGWALSLIHI